MKRQIAVAALTAFISASAIAAPKTYVMDPEHTFSRFSYDHLGLSKQILRFNKTTGTVILDKDAKKAEVNAIIDMKSIDTGTVLDEHMDAPDLLDMTKHPTATFKSTKINFQGDKPASIEGDLTIKGITKPITLTVTSFYNGPHPTLKKDAIGANALGTVKRSDFNAVKYLPVVGDEITIDIALEAIAE